METKPPSKGNRSKKVLLRKIKLLPIPQKNVHFKFSYILWKIKLTCVFSVMPKLHSVGIELYDINQIMNKINDF